jgi:hypothetical protein
VKEYYESLRLYHESHQEVYDIPLVIAQEIPVAIPTNEHPTTNNLFINYGYVEAHAC